MERQLSLVKLLSRQNKYRPASYYGNKLFVSTKTIYQDIDILKDYAKQFNVQIDSLPSVGIKISGADGNINQLLSKLELDTRNDMYSPDNRRIEVMKQVLFGEKKPSLENLSNYFMVSKTSLYNDLKLINKIIEIENVKVTSSIEGIEITGDEAEVQKAIKQLVFYYANNVQSKTFRQVLEMLFDPEIVNIVYRLLFNEYSELTEKVSDYYVRSLLSILIIQCNRLLKGYHVQSEEDFLFNSIRYMETYIVANSLIEELSQSVKLEFNQDDREYLCRQLFAHRVTNSLKVSNENYSAIVQKLIKRMSEIEKLDLTNNEHLYNSLLYHIPAMVLRLKKGIRIQNPLLENIKSQYSELFSIVWYALVVIEKEYDVALNDEEVSLILIHFQIAIENQSKSHNIIIICEYGMSSAQLIYNRVRRFLPAREHVEISTIEKLQSADRKDIDLIISSLDFDSENIPYVKVSPLVSNQDYVRIMEAYTKYIIEKVPCGLESESALEKFKAPTLAKFIEPSLIKIGVEVASKEECLDLMISELEQRDYVTTDFRKSTFDREKLGNTNLESGAALPHANPNTVIKSHVSLLTLKKPINWGERKVKLVTMINFSEENAQEIRAVVEELYQIIESKESVDAVVAIQDKEMMLRLFKTERN